MIPMSLRTAKSEEKYQLAKAEGKTHPLKDVESIKDYKHWRIIPNEYPADMVYKESHLLIPKRVVSTWQYLNEDEADELWFILDGIEKEGLYDAISINPPKRRSVANHFHIHLFIFYEDRSHISLTR